MKRESFTQWERTQRLRAGVILAEHAWNAAERGMVDHMQWLLDDCDSIEDVHAVISNLSLEVHS